MATTTLRDCRCYRAQSTAVKHLVRSAPGFDLCFSSLAPPRGGAAGGPCLARPARSGACRPNGGSTGRRAVIHPRACAHCNHRNQRAGRATCLHCDNAAVNQLPGLGAAPRRLRPGRLGRHRRGRLAGADARGGGRAAVGWIGVASAGVPPPGLGEAACRARLLHVVVRVGAAPGRSV